MRSIIFILMFAPVIVLAQPCPAPMSAVVFKQKLHQLALQPNDQKKLQFSRTILSGSCVLSSQVKELANVFSGDYYRFEFSKQAWHHTFDPINFYDVYDAFANLSSALRLYDYVNHAPAQHFPVNEPLPATNWYPNLAYPTTIGYKGQTGCNLPLADNDFEMLARVVVVQKTDAQRRKEALNLLNSNCLSLMQLMKLSTLFGLESNRLSFLKETFSRIYDLENCSYVTEVFTHLLYQNDWLIYCTTVLNEPAPEPAVLQCEITQNEFDDIKRSIGNVSVNSTRVTMAKQVISSKKCFTVKQIAGIIALFSIESSRLELALFSYDFCINTGDYYQLAESLSTTSSKNRLLEFINSKK